MKWTAPAALLATTLLAGTGKAQNFTYRAGTSYAQTGGAVHHSGGGLGGQLSQLTAPYNARLGGFGLLGFGADGYRLGGTFNNYAAFGNGGFGVFGKGSSFGSGGFGSGYLLANLFPQIHPHGPLFNYGPYYGYPPFEPYGPWDAYLRYHDPLAGAGGDDCGRGRCGLGRGNPHPLCGTLCRRRAAGGDGCEAANEVTRGGLCAARRGHGWGTASGECGGAGGVPVASRYAGCGSPAASEAYYTGCAVPSVTPPAAPATPPTTMPAPDKK